MNPRIYLAGKITKNGWRNGLVSGIDTNERYESRLAGDPWPILEGAVIDLFDYTGPYFTACDHGCAHSKVNRDSCFGDPKHEPLGGLHGLQQEMCQEAARADQVFALCQEAIRQSDIVFAWITAPDLYGTVYELGIAHGQGIPTAIAFCTDDNGPEYNSNEYWLAAEGAAWTLHAHTAKHGLNALHEALGSSAGTRLLRRYRLRTRRTP